MTSSRATTFAELFGDYTGIIVADALGTHGAGARAGPGISLPDCWEHVFRRFEQALPDHPDAEGALAWIGALYDTDRRGEGDLGSADQVSVPLTCAVAID